MTADNSPCLQLSPTVTGTCVQLMSANSSPCLQSLPTDTPVYNCLQIVRVYIYPLQVPVPVYN